MKSILHFVKSILILSLLNVGAGCDHPRKSSRDEIKVQSDLRSLGGEIHAEYSVATPESKLIFLGLLKDGERVNIGYLLQEVKIDSNDLEYYIFRKNRKDFYIERRSGSLFLWWWGPNGIDEHGSGDDVGIFENAVF